MKKISAEQILKYYTNIYKIPDMTNLALDLGIRSYLVDFIKHDRVYKCILEEGFIRGSYIEDINQISKKILVEDSQDIAFRRFTIAYLLSEYLLDKIDNHYSIMVDSNYDKETLLFARDLLIPNYLYDKTKNKSINYIKEYYNVPDFIAASKIKKFGGIK